MKFLDFYLFVYLEAKTSQNENISDKNPFLQKFPSTALCQCWLLCWGNNKAAALRCLSLGKDDHHPTIGTVREVPEKKDVRM
jgi:hypothetical protein